MLETPQFTYLSGYMNWRHTTCRQFSTGGLNLKLFTGLTGLGDKYLAEIYCKIIYYKMNQFEARSILTTSMEKYSSRK